MTEPSPLSSAAPSPDSPAAPSPHHPGAAQWPRLGLGDLIQTTPIRSVWSGAQGAWVKLGGSPAEGAPLLPRGEKPGLAPPGAAAVVTLEGRALRSWPLHGPLPEGQLHVRPVLWITPSRAAHTLVDAEWLAWVAGSYLEDRAAQVAQQIGQGQVEAALLVSETVKRAGTLAVRVPPLQIQRDQMRRIGPALRQALNLELRQRQQVRGLHQLSGALVAGLRQGRWTEAAPGADLGAEDASVLRGLLGVF